MESLIATVLAAGIGVVGTLLVQRITRGWTRRDEMLALRNRWASDVLTQLRSAWSARPFDPESFEVFLPASAPHSLRFIDPSANRVSTWLSFQLQIMLSKLDPMQDMAMKGTQAFFVYDEHMRRVEPLLVGWALGKRGYGPRAVERWLWAANDEVHKSHGRELDSREMRKLARRYARLDRVRPR